MFDLDALCGVGLLPADSEGGAADGGDAVDGGGRGAGPGHDEGLRGPAVEALACGQRLHLERVLVAPLAVRVGVVELVLGQHRLDDAVHVHLVARDHRLPVRVRFVPLDGDVAEVARSVWRNNVRTSE